MKKLDLDYAVSAKPYPLGLRLSLLLLAVASVIMTVAYYRALQAELNHYQTVSATESRAKQVTTSNRPELTAASSHASNVRKSLSYPWLTLFSYLEAIKSKHAKVDLLKVVPNKARSEVRIEGEAKSFDEITHLINDLKSHEAFEDAILVNHYLVEPDSPRENGGKPLLSFNLLLKWSAE